MILSLRLESSFGREPKRSRKRLPLRLLPKLLKRHSKNKMTHLVRLTLTC